MTESLHLEVELPPRPIGTRFTYKPNNVSVYDAEIIGYCITHLTDTQSTAVNYRVTYDFAGQCIVTNVPRATVERALGGKS